MRFALILLLFATPALAAPSAGKLLQFDEDLDGDGQPETITLDKDGTLMAGLGETKPKYDEDDGPAHTRIEVVPLGGKRRGIYLVTELQEGEDPSPRHQIFLYQPGSLKLVFDQFVSEKKIKFSKLGTGRYVESGWDVCAADERQAKTKPRMRAKERIVTLRLNIKGTKMIELRKNTDKVVRCDELAG